MTNRPRSRTLPGLSFVAALVLSAPSALAAPPTSDDLAHWAHRVWDAALDGDVQTVERQFDALPSDPTGADSTERFRSALSRWRANHESAAADTASERDEAMVAMRDEVDAGHLANALRQALRVQALSADLDEAFDNEEIMSLIEWAKARIPELEQHRAWLEAQELLYRLRTFYDDTDRRDEYEHYDEHLELVNRRVALLAQYVPRRLHEMRNEQAIRMGEEPFGEFNPATAPDWRERLEGVDHRMLKTSLNTAAVEHIETEGWRPLLVGGLEAMRVLATTTALEETFPNLGDAGRVGQWIEHIDGALRALANVEDRKLDRWYLSEILARLIDVNERTLELPKEVIYREFGDGAMNELDSYSEIIWPDKFHRFQQATAGNFVGIGVVIRHNDKREIVVENPLEGTPAFRGGVHRGDLIVEVDGDTTAGWSLNDAVDRITGPRGTNVRLGLRREGVDGLVELVLKRDHIKIRSVNGWWKTGLDERGNPDWDWYIDPVSRIGYLRLTGFTEDSFDDILAAWGEMSRDGRPNGLILDLRHNPGGLLPAAVNIANLFVDQGTIVTREDKNAFIAGRHQAQPNRALLAEVPTVVLINRGSASASEIVAGCLQAHGAALVVGERSFGKGSVQNVLHIAADGCVKLTTQYYRLPSPDGQTPGRLVHKRPGADDWGVVPDIEVRMTDLQVEDAVNLRRDADVIPVDDLGNVDVEAGERPDVNDLLATGIDPQLETALLLLQTQALAPQGVRHARGDR